MSRRLSEDLRNCGSMKVGMLSSVPVLDFHFPDGHTLPSRVGALERADVLGLPAFRALGDVEFHTLALLQALEAACLDCREVHEYIFASLTADEAVALSIIKPLYCSLFCHLVLVFLSIDLRWKGFGSTEGRR